MVSRAGGKALINFGATVGRVAGAHGGDARHRQAAAARQGGRAGDDAKPSGSRSATFSGAGSTKARWESEWGSRTSLWRRGKRCTRCSVSRPERRTTIFVHMRSSGPVEPGAVDSLQEVIADATAAGTSVHVVHITSTALRETPLCLAMIAGARERRLDITTEAYPYTAGMTDLSSAIFSRGLGGAQGGITLRDLQWAATGNGSRPNRSRDIGSRAGWSPSIRSRRMS